jgi:hypothetical protein
VTVELFWQALRRPSADYTIFVHVQDADGTLIAQNDSQPEGGNYPTGVWSPGEIVMTTHPIMFPSPLSNEPYTLYVGLYTWPDLQRLPVSQYDVLIEAQQALLAVLPGSD